MSHQDFLCNLSSNLLTKPVDDLKNEEFASAVGSGDVKFITVVESMQKVLTNENVNVREKGVWFLSWLLSKLPKELLLSSEISVILNFYLSCLESHHNLISPVIRGFIELVKMKHITKEDVTRIVLKLFQHVNCQTQLQADRVIIYSILKFVIENRLEEIKEAGPHLVHGVISFIEMEADPFCLMEIFSFLPIFVKSFDLGHFSEELFEVLSCYFPIDFNPSANETLLITREDLSQGLHKCLSAHSSLSEQSIPLILEKADSSSKQAKVDSYKLLQDCCTTLDVENLEKNISNLWKCLSKDILPGNDKQICDAGLCALADIFHLLSKHESHLQTLTTFVNDIVTTVKSLTNRVDENMFQPAIRVLVAVASRSKPAASQILQYLKIFFQLESTTTLLEKKIILLSLLPFLKIYREFRMIETTENSEKSNYLDLVTMYIDAATSFDYEIRKLAFQGILEVLPDLTSDMRKKLFEIILQNIMTKNDIKNSDDFVKIWRNLAENQVEFYNFVSKNLSINNAEPNFLWALSLIADLPKFTNQIIQTLIDVIITKEKYDVGLESLLNACRSAKLNNSTDFFRVIHFEHSVLEHLISWSLKFEPKNLLLERHIVDLITEIIASITRNLDESTQQTLADKITPMFLGSHENGSECLTFSGQNLIDFSSDSAIAVSILEAVLGSVRREVTIPMIMTLQEKLINNALKSPNDSVRLSSSRLLATVVNKAEEFLVLDLLKRVHEEIFMVSLKDSDIKVRLNASYLFSWIMKGLVLRSGEVCEEWISSWFTLLEREDVGESIAEGFRTVIEENNLYLNLESHCNIRVLYRQRLFAKHPKLVKMIETSNSSVKMNYLLALVRLLQGVPIHLIQMEISNIITIFVRCLDTEKHEVLLTSLEILSSLLEKKESIFSDYVQSFVPKLLKLARFEGSMSIRINSLKCLYFYGFYPTVILLPVKNQVIQELEICLDDKKRLARKEAVKARCRWFLIGAPGESILNS